MRLGRLAPMPGPSSLLAPLVGRDNLEMKRQPWDMAPRAGARQWSAWVFPGEHDQEPPPTSVSGEAMAAKTPPASFTAGIRSAAVTTMKAIVQHHYGPPDVLAVEEIAKPAVGDEDVLIRVHSAAAACRHHGHSAAIADPRQIGQAVQRRAVRPVHILDHQADRRPPGYRRQQLSHRGEQPLAPPPLAPAVRVHAAGPQLRQQALDLHPHVRRAIASAASSSPPPPSWLSSPSAPATGSSGSFSASGRHPPNTEINPPAAARRMGWA